MNIILKLLIILNIVNYNFLFAQESNLINYLPPRYVKDASVDYTSYIQKCLNENDIVVFPEFPLLVNDQGLNIKSNQKIVFKTSSKLVLKATSKGNYSLLHLNGVNNVALENIQLEGDKYKHKGSSGEWGMGVKINNSQNIQISNCKISKCWGDGIYITGRTTDNIKIFGGLINDNRRNGISIISGKNIHLKDLTISKTKGAWPMAAIDIEPNSHEKDLLGKIVLENIISKNNYQGISVVLNNYISSKTKTIDINTINYTSVQDNIGLKINPFVNNKSGLNNVRLQGQIKFENISLGGVEKHAILVKGKVEDYYLAPNLVFKNVKVGTKNNVKNQFKSLNKKRFFLLD